MTSNRLRRSQESCSDRMIALRMRRKSSDERAETPAAVHQTRSAPRETPMLCPQAVSVRGSRVEFVARTMASARRCAECDTLRDSAPVSNAGFRFSGAKRGRAVSRPTRISDSCQAPQISTPGQSHGCGGVESTFRTQSSSWSSRRIDLKGSGTSRSPKELRTICHTLREDPAVGASSKNAPIPPRRRETRD